MKAHATLLALSLIAWSGCRCRPEQESAVDVPTTLDAVKALKDPPEVEVAIVRESQPKSSHVACGHSAACVIVLPVALLAPLFPNEWDVATVTRDGSTVYEGRFATDGRFLDAKVWEEDRVRAIGTLGLGQLRREFIVELATAPAGTEDDPSAWTPSSILDQVDITDAYRTQLANTQNELGRRALYLEMVGALREEAIEPLVELLPGDSAAGLVVTELCIDHRSSPGPSCEQLLDRLSPNASGLLAIALFRESHRRHDHERTTRLGKVLIADVCEGEHVDALTDLSGLARQGADQPGQASMLAAWREAADGCATARRVHLRHALGQSVEEDALVAALAEPDAAADTLVAGMANDDPRAATLLGRAIERRVASQQPARGLMRKLGMLDAPPDATEVALMTRVFVEAAGDEETRHVTRACALHRVRLARDAGRDMEAVRATWRRAHADAAPDAQAPLAVALATVGEHTHAAEVVAAFDGYVHVPHVCFDATTRSALLGFGLTEAGCDGEAVLAMQRDAKIADRPPPKTVACLDGGKRSGAE